MSDKEPPGFLGMARVFVSWLLCIPADDVVFPPDHVHARTVQTAPRCSGGIPNLLATPGGILAPLAAFGGIYWRHSQPLLCSLLVTMQAMQAMWGCVCVARAKSAAHYAVFWFLCYIT